jgi:FkbM family methyltransferase
LNGILRLAKQLLPENPSLVDVGAAKGEFTFGFLEAFPRARTFLFEPTRASVQHLTLRFAGNPLVRIFNCALSDAEGVVSLNTFGQSENNSLLPSLFEEAVASVDGTTVDTLDGVLGTIDKRPKVGLIKIDTQGTDLRVLQGARRTIENDQPLILVETIFVPLYGGQDSYFDILSFMKSIHYELAGFYEAHATPEGLLAFADLLFIPAEVHKRLVAGHQLGTFNTLDADHLNRQIKVLEGICAERLSLIERLQSAADERLALIQELTRVAEERLRVIESLDAELQKVKGGS